MTLKENWKYRIGWIYIIIGFITYNYGVCTDDMQIMAVSLFTVGIMFVFMMYLEIMKKLTAVKVEICNVQEFLERLGEIKDNSSDEQF